MKQKYILIKKGIIFICIFLCIGLILLAGSLFFPCQYYEKKIIIPKGLTAEDVACILKEENIIRSKLLFLILAKLKGLESEIKAGTYSLNNRMGILKILNILQRGERIPIRFTIPEGLTLQEVAQLLEKNGLVKKERFLKICKDKSFLKDKIPEEADSAEGYLFPETYEIVGGFSEEDIINLLLNQFQKQIQKEKLEKKIEDSGLTLHQVITLASIIEEEAFLEEEKPLISSVYHNRLKRNMHLEADPTVQYALGRHKKRVTFKDLKVDSPYNTYIHKGLPPGPICNPGISAIKAAAMPKKSPYLYFVAKPDGSHFFSRTFEEHKVKKKRASFLRKKELFQLNKTSNR